MATLTISSVSNGSIFLERYIEKQEFFFIKKYGEDRAKKELQSFNESINKIITRVNNFIFSSETSLSILCLGQIQSGKTAHLMGSIAYAGDARFDLTIVLTGLTTPLNNQTIDRIQKDLINNNLIQIDVPSNVKNKDFNLFLNEIKNEINSKNNSKYYVLTVLKSKARLNTLKYLLIELRKMKPDLKIFLIDDEADVGSQNSKARKKNEAVIYKKIYEIRNLAHRNVLLSYTATPQAILLTESFGKLRPDFCITIEPKAGYFGLSNLLSQEYSNQIVIIDDWHADNLAQNISPKSLDYALINFLYTYLFRKYFPSIFYYENNNQINYQKNMQSVQMMVHQSSRQQDHQNIYNVIRNRINDFYNLIEDIDIQNDSLDQINNSVLGEVYRRFYFLLSKFIFDLPKNLDWEIIKLLKSLSKPEIRIINSDSKLEDDRRKLPVQDSEWEQFESWILVGGDILGRGVTIPQLTTTYFLRNSKKPNLDTVLQQMRFCGYRDSYIRMTSIHMTEEHKNTFKYMDLVNRIVWNKAKEWENHNFNLKKDISKIIYAQPSQVNFEPTRKSVRDPNLIDKKLNDTTFQARRIYPMGFTKNNANLLRSWLFELKFSLSQMDNNWYSIENIDVFQILNLLSNWTVDPNEKPVLLGILDLFDRNFESLGFAETPISLFIRQPQTIQSISKLNNLSQLVSDITSVRTLNNSHELKWKDWESSFDYNSSKLIEYQKFSLTAVGGSQRSLRNFLEYDSTLIIIEPIKFLSQNKKNKQPIGIGITLNILSPLGYQTRIMGYK